MEFPFLRTQMEQTMNNREALRPKAPIERWLLPVIVWIFPFVAIALGLRRWLPPLASDHGADIDVMLYYLLITIGGLLLTGNLILGYFIWRFSRAGEVTYHLPSPKVERRWSLIPIVVMALVAEGGVFLLGLPVWNSYFAASPPPNSVVVDVIAEQFVWNVRYAGADGRLGRNSPTLYAYDNPMGLDPDDPAALDDIVTMSRIVLPVNRPARIRLRSKDVLHSFFLPHLRVKQDVVPGMSISVWFIPTKTGTYELACAELCGTAHYTMRGVLRVVTAEEFDAWLGSEIPFFAP